MAKQVFHDLSEIGVLKKDIPYTNADLREISKGLDKIVGEIKSLKREVSNIQDASSSTKDHAFQKSKVKNNKAQARKASPKKTGTIINNVFVKRTSPDYQIAALMVRQHKSMDGLSSYAKYYQEFFGEAKFNSIREIAAMLFEQEKTILSYRFSVGSSYSFKVFSSTRQGNNVLTELVDKEHAHHKVFTKAVYPAGKEVRCEIKSIDFNQPIGWQLDLGVPRLIIIDKEPATPPKILESKDEKQTDDTPVYKKSPGKWFREVDGLGYHKCGKAFTCNCCGRSFNAGQGYRIDLKEIYFCTECKKEIFKPSGRGYMSIVYTNMGHKR